MKLVEGAEGDTSRGGDKGAGLVSTGPGPSSPRPDMAGPVNYRIHTLAGSLAGTLATAQLCRILREDGCMHWQRTNKPVLLLCSVH